MTIKGFKHLLLLSLFCLSGTLSAQFYTAGSDPVTKWRQIKSEHYTIIYPQQIDSLARRYLSLFENSRSAVMEPLGIEPKHIPIVLHPFTAISNGVVTWAPKRVDVFTTPPAYENTSEPWDKSVVVHESRHIGQVSHFEKGVYKYLYFLLGEQSPGIGVGLYPSNLFLEGDAVITETELSNAGRGRNADFLQYSRAMFLNGDYRNWDRLRFGSYRYYTPNHYVMGYIINTSLRYSTGNYFYPSQYLDYMVKHFYNPRIIFNTFNSIAGQKRIFFLEEGQKMMTDIWKNELEDKGTLTEARHVVDKPARLYCDYRYPVHVKDSLSKYYNHILALKKGMEFSQTLIAVGPDGKERPIRPFSSHTSPLSVSSKGLVYWTETTSHDVSQLEDYSELKSFDLRSGRIHSRRWNTRYFNPAPSTSGDTIAVAEYPISGSSFLVLLDAADEKGIFRIEAPLKGQIKETVWIGSDIYCSAILDQGLGIYRLRDGQWSEIIPQQNRTIVGMKAYRNGICFTSDLDGVNNIYYYDFETSVLSRLTNSKYGASDPFIEPSEGILYYSEFDIKGYHLGKNNLDSLEKHVMHFEKPYRHPIAEMLSLQAKNMARKHISDSIDCYDLEKYPSKKYSRFTHLFRIHSWAPVYYNIDRIRSMSYDRFYDLAAVGATVYSQNTLGTAVTMLGYSYHKGFHAGHINFTYSGWAPTIEASIDFNDRNVTRYVVNSETEEVEKTDLLHNPYLSSSLKIYMPLILSCKGWNKGFIPEVSWNFSNDLFYSYEKSKFLYKNQINYGLRYYQMLPIPKSAIFPRWGFGFSLMGASAPWTGENFGNMAYAYGYVYLPGITRQQGIKITGTYQKQFVNNKVYYLSSYAYLPRGYTKNYPTETFAKATIDYAIPIYLGDFSIWSLLYVQRLQLIPFGDYAWDANPVNNHTRYYSYGIDALFNIYPLRFNFPLSIGVRYARTGPQEGNRNYLKFLFSVSL